MYEKNLTYKWNDFAYVSNGYENLHVLYGRMEL